MTGPEHYVAAEQLAEHSRAMAPPTTPRSAVADERSAAPDGRPRRGAGARDPGSGRGARISAELPGADMVRWREVTAIRERSSGTSFGLGMRQAYLQRYF
jgi:hypothetical protein